MPTPESTGRTVYDVQRDLDLDASLEAAVPPPACEWKVDKLDPDSPRCGAAATWLVVFSCGHTAYLDDEHHAVFNRWAAKANAIGCTHPGAPRHPAPLRVVVLDEKRVH